MVIGVNSAAVLALDQPEFGGNNASDYQPATRNPQSDILTGLQPNTNTNLQPAPVGINPQNLVQAGGLTVLTSPDKGATSTTSQPLSPQKPKSSLYIWVIGGVLTLIAIVYVVRKPDIKTGKPQPAVIETAVTQAPKRTKPAEKKSTRKKRKSSRR